MSTHEVHIITTIFQYVKVHLHLTEDRFPNILPHRHVSIQYWHYFRCPNGATSATPFLCIRAENKRISFSCILVPVREVTLVTNLKPLTD
jgi:hypothetical protein